MKDLTVFPVQNQAIAALTTSALAGEHVTTAALVEALTQVLETTGLPIAVAEGGAMILNMEAQLDMLEQAERRLAGRRAYLESLHAAAKGWALKLMQDADVKQVSGGIIDIARKKNPPKVEILNENEIPQLYRKVELIDKIDRMAIAAALKDGMIVPGARLTQNERLEVK